MSAGAVFKLVANDGKADRMIMATALLNQRIKDVMCARASAGKEDPTPTLVDLEKTHIVYVNAHFKPFAAIGFEYNKVRASAGNPTLGSSVTFSIPQFGDFFHDMVLRTRLSQFSGNSLTYSLTTNATANTNNAYDAYGRLYTGNLTSSAATPISYNNLVRYCEFPANRLVAQVKFDVNGNPLDQYSVHVSTMLEKFTIPTGKRVGYNRLTGQQVPRECYSAPNALVVTDGNVTQTPTGITNNAAGQSNRTVNLFNSTGTGSGGFPNGGGAYAQAANATSTLNSNYTAGTITAGQFQYVSAQKLTSIVDGPQTPKPVQPALELWHKLKFWFCDDVRLAVPSVSIPFGQRFITVTLAPQSQLAYEFPNMYVFLANTIGDTYANTPIVAYGGTTSIAVEQIELYINNIFVNPEIHDIYIKRIGFSLIRVYREQQSRQNQATSGSELLSQLKWPVEYMYVGLRPAWNIVDPVNTAPAATTAQPSTTTPSTISIGNLNSWRDWHRMTRQVDARFTGNVGGLSAAAAADAAGLTPDFSWLPVSTVDGLSLQAHGITIFDAFQDIFYSEYMPYNYGGAALNTPNDHGAFFVNMALFPRSYQPSGHLNISRARETYLGWSTSYITSNTPADLIVVAVAINFLLISDGSAVLRYST